MSYIYILVDPRDLASVRYVGWTVHPTKRLRAHISCKNRKRTYKDNWIQRLLAESVQPELVIIEEVNEDNWQERERYWIQYYRNLGHKLTNATDGGDGAPGLKQSEKQRCASMETIRRLNRDLEFQKSRNERLKIMNEDPAFQKKQRLAASKVSKETMTRLHQDPEFQKQTRERMEQRHADPEFREKSRCAASQTMRRLHQNAQFHAKIAIISHTPEANAKRSASIKATWARKRREQRLDEALILRWSDDGGS